MWQKKAEQVTKPFLNALGDDYSVCCQGMISKIAANRTILYTIVSL